MIILSRGQQIFQSTWSIFWIVFSAFWVHSMYAFQQHFYVEYPIYVAIKREYTHVLIECIAFLIGVALILYKNARAIRIVAFVVIQYALIFFIQKVFKTGRTQLDGPFYVGIGFIVFPKLREYADVLAWGWVNGLIVGRWACFLTGVQDGTAGDEVWWGLDQGDGKFRIPSALFESLFMCAMGLVIAKTRQVNGICSVIAYCLFRMINDTFRPHVGMKYIYYSIVTILVYVLVELYSDHIVVKRKYLSDNSQHNYEKSSSYSVSVFCSKFGNKIYKCK